MKKVLINTYYFILFLVFLVVAHLLALFVPIEADAQTLKWRHKDESNIKGYKIYWQLVHNCNDVFVGDFKYSVNVGHTNTYNIWSDYNFRFGELYQFKMTAYNKHGIESLQSDIVLCAEIGDRPDQITEIELGKKKLQIKEK